MMVPPAPVGKLITSNGARVSNSARNRPGGMDAPASQDANHLLAKLAQADPFPGQIRISRDQAGQISLRRLALHPQQ